MENITENIQENGTETEIQERTFTQSELDEIIKSRLAKERAKYGNFEELQAKAAKLDEITEANKTELQRATEKADELQKQLDAMTRERDLKNLREKVANDTGVPASLLLGETEEACMEQAYSILAFKNAQQNGNYPSVKDGGEVQNVSHTKSAAEQFEEWFNAALTN